MVVPHRPLTSHAVEMKIRPRCMAGERQLGSMLVDPLACLRNEDESGSTIDGKKLRSMDLH